MLSMSFQWLRLIRSLLHQTKDPDIPNKQQLIILINKLFLQHAF